MTIQKTLITEIKANAVVNGEDLGVLLTVKMHDDPEVNKKLIEAAEQQAKQTLEWYKENDK